MSARCTQPRPSHLQDVTRREHTFVLPWVETSGTGAMAYNNSVHAAIHSLFNALQLKSGGPSSPLPAKPAKFTKRDVAEWIDAAWLQIDAARHKIRGKRAKLTREPSRKRI